jgi:hypothetical protein
MAGDTVVSSRGSTIHKMVLCMIPMATGTTRAAIRSTTACVVQHEQTCAGGGKSRRLARRMRVGIQQLHEKASPERLPAVQHQETKPHNNRVTHPHEAIHQVNKQPASHPAEVSNHSRQAPPVAERGTTHPPHQLHRPVDTVQAQTTHPQAHRDA